MSRPRRRYLVPVTLLVALAVNAVWLPAALRDWAPLWLYLTLAFWAVSLPSEMRLRAAWGFGLVQDLLLGVWTGVHVLSYSVTVYLLARVYAHSINTPPTYRALLVAPVLAGHLVYLHLMMRMATDAPLWAMPWEHWVGSVIVIVPLFYLLEAVRNRILAS